MNIPDDAVNAASEAIYDEFGYAHGLNGTECDRVAEVALRFAAPFIAAQALRDVVSKPGMRVRQKTDYGYVEETVYSRDTLASRADELDPQ